VNQFGRMVIWVVLVIIFGFAIAMASLATAFSFTPHNASKVYLYFIFITQVPALIACAIFGIWLATAIAFEKPVKSVLKLAGVSVSIYLLSWFMLVAAAKIGLIK